MHHADNGLCKSCVTRTHFNGIYDFVHIWNNGNCTIVRMVSRKFYRAKTESCVRSSVCNLLNRPVLIDES